MAVRKPTAEERRYFEHTAAAKSKGAGGGGNASTLASMLEEAGLVSSEMIRDLIPADESAASLKHTLVAQGLVRDDDILQVIAAAQGYEQMDLKDLNITPELLAQIETRH